MKLYLYVVDMIKRNWLFFLADVWRVQSFRGKIGLGYFIIASFVATLFCVWNPLYDLLPISVAAFLVVLLFMSWLYMLQYELYRVLRGIAWVYVAHIRWVWLPGLVVGFMVSLFCLYALAVMYIYPNKTVLSSIFYHLRVIAAVASVLLDGPPYVLAGLSKFFRYFEFYCNQPDLLERFQRDWPYFMEYLEYPPGSQWVQLVYGFFALYYIWKIFYARRW